eukprot:TRINITY_DN7578_c0_g1_i4.p2 TRINITY_DN7578_c0_g1~~TRINITY_DN7578_c0_g1_i4.p2  ORF type:complete len:173 (-),score=14.12 TRINITY_DN7578_c0_g1_i4:159-677(-)
MSAHRTHEYTLSPHIFSLFLSNLKMAYFMVLVAHPTQPPKQPNTMSPLVKYHFSPHEVPHTQYITDELVLESIDDLAGAIWQDNLEDITDAHEAFGHGLEQTGSDAKTDEVLCSADLPSFGGHYVSNVEEAYVYTIRGQMLEMDRHRLADVFLTKRFMIIYDMLTRPGRPSE